MKSRKAAVFVKRERQAFDAGNNAGGGGEGMRNAIENVGAPAL
jgi:hypothetical protein